MKKITKTYLILMGLSCIGKVATAEEPMHWLKNPNIEAGFTWESGIRLLVLRVPGEENLLREVGAPCIGLKTWMMAPSDLLESRASLSELPAKLFEESPFKIRIKTIEASDRGLVLEWRVQLDPSEPVLRVDHIIHSQAKRQEYLSICSLAAFSPDSIFRIPFKRSPEVYSENPNNLAIFPFTDIADTRISSTENYLQVELRNQGNTGSIKLGYVQKDGKIQVQKSDRIIEFSVPYFADALYPEGGSNVTTYATPDKGLATFGEVEHLSPLQLLAPGKSIVLRQIIKLVD